MVGGAAAVLSSVTDNQISWPFFHHRFTKNLWYHFFFFPGKINHACILFQIFKNRKHQGYITSWWCTPIFLKENACTNCISTTATSRKIFLKLAQIFTPCLMMILCPRGANLFVNIQLSLSNKYLNLWTKFVLFSYLSLYTIACMIIVYTCLAHIQALLYWHVWWHLLQSPHWHGSNLVFNDRKWQFSRLSTWCTCINPLGKFQNWS